MNSIFLIEKMWTDWLENHLGNAKGWEVVGFVETEEEAKKIVEEGGKCKESKWPPVSADENKYSYREVKKMP